MLEVAVHQYHRVALRERQTGRRRRFLAEIARQPHDAHPCRPGGGERRVRGAVAAAVVDDQQLRVDALGPQHPLQRLEEGADELALVVGRHDHRHERPAMRVLGRVHRGAPR
ncbi:MAG: hypothetical protein O9972_61885 [Burkholderiales bacterium]|jgi:hypothetical protein|nr:hypothetical protein [Burkholderiales bacterium]